MPEEKRERLKALIKAVHEGTRPEEVREGLKALLEELGPVELARVEQELIEEGMPPEEVHRLCEVHLALLKDSAEGPEVPTGHPIHILLREHEFVKGVVGEFPSLSPRLEEGLERLEQLLGHLREYDNHKVREENALFPYLERHGFSQPPAVMWTEHDQQREQIKALEGLLWRAREDLGGVREELARGLEDLKGMVLSHFQKEEKVLFPTALKLIGPQEWLEIKASMDELGYCSFTPREAIGERAVSRPRKELSEGKVELPTGGFTLEELEAVLNALPIDITFVDAQDRVRYFNDPRERIFPRTTAILGRKVQQCHPQKSVAVVNRILEDFREGKRDSAEFWIDMGGRKVHIRYFAVRDPRGRYLGCLEATQDITDIKGIEGEKRLLDLEGD